MLKFRRQQRPPAVSRAPGVVPLSDTLLGMAIAPADFWRAAARFWRHLPAAVVSSAVCGRSAVTAVDGVTGWPAGQRRTGGGTGGLVGDGGAMSVAKENCGSKDLGCNAGVAGMLVVCWVYELAF